MQVDARDRIIRRESKKKSIWSYVFGTILIIALLGFAGKNLLQLESVAIKAVQSTIDRPMEINAPAATQQLLEPIKTPIKMVEEITEAKPAPPAAKQTVFNDQNYQPKGSINTIAPPPSRYYEQGQARTNAQIRELQRSFNGVNNTRSIPWSWKSQKTHRSGTFTYVERSGRIDTTSVCANYKYGSLIYRDCRKAAKKYFRDACSSQFKAACGAADMIP